MPAGRLSDGDLDSDLKLNSSLPRSRRPRIGTSASVTLRHINPGGQGTALSLAATIGFAVRPASDGRARLSCVAGNEGVVGSELAARAQSVVAVRSLVAHARPVASTRLAAQLAVRLLAPLAQ